MNDGSSLYVCGLRRLTAEPSIEMIPSCDGGTVETGPPTETAEQDETVVEEDMKLTVDVSDYTNTWLLVSCFFSFY